MLVGKGSWGFDSRETTYKKSDLMLVIIQNNIAGNQKENKNRKEKIETNLGITSSIILWVGLHDISVKGCFIK